MLLTCSTMDLMTHFGCLQLQFPSSSSGLSGLRTMSSNECSHQGGPGTRHLDVFLYIKEIIRINQKKKKKTLSEFFKAADVPGLTTHLQ